MPYPKSVNIMSVCAEFGMPLEPQAMISKLAPVLEAEAPDVIGQLTALHLGSISDALDTIDAPAELKAHVSKLEDAV